MARADGGHLRKCIGRLPVSQALFGPVEKGGDFYRFLEVGRPKSFTRYGKLSARQVERSLNRTKPKGAPSLSQFLAPYYQPT